MKIIFQLIPYVLIRDRQQRIVYYRRKGSETRIHGCFSLGFGGHINSCDFQKQDLNIFSCFQRNINRELFEETGISGLNPDFQGVISENITSVGRTHLGFVFIVDCFDQNLCVSEEIDRFYFESPQNLIKPESLSRFEIWSDLALRLVFGNK